MSHSDGKGTWTRHRHRHRHHQRGRRIVSSAAIPLAPKTDRQTDGQADRQRQWQLLNYFCCSLSNLQNEIETGKTFFYSYPPPNSSMKHSEHSAPPTQFSLLIFLSLYSALSAVLLTRPTGIGEPAKGWANQLAKPSPSSLLNALTLPPSPHPVPSSSSKQRPPTGAVSFAGHSCGHSLLTLHMPWTCLNLQCVL